MIDEAPRTQVVGAKTRPRLKRALIAAGIAVVIAGGLAPFLPLPFLRPSIEGALARRLGRRVDIEEVSLSLFGGPGFSLSGVTIHEDPRAGIEPFAYAQTVDARVDLLGLLAGRRGFSSLRLADATLNLVRTRAGEWNLAYLLNARLSDAPSLHLRGARVNLKFDQTKSVLYFDDADVDISPGDQGSLDVRFSGSPARTDRPAQNFGHLFVRAAWIPASADRPLNVRVDLEPSSLDGLAKLFGRSWFDLQGQVSFSAQLAGKPAQMVLAGEAQLDEGRRSDFLPSRDGKWSVPYRGTLDLLAEKLDLESVAEGAAPLAVRVEGRDLLTSPQWQASAEFNEAPLAVAVDAARRLGAPFPPKLSAEGTVSGTVLYAEDRGLSGDLSVGEAVLAMPDAPALRFASVPVTLADETVNVGPTVASVASSGAGEKTAEKSAESQSLQVEASYKLDGSGESNLKISTRGLDLASLRAFALAPIFPPSGSDPPAEERAISGPLKAIWRGSLRYQRSDPGAGAWSGDYSVENARVPVDGIADPVRVLSANISAGPGRLALTKIRAKVGEIAVSGEYRWDSKDAAPAGEESKAPRAGKIKLQIEAANAAELDRLFRPTLVRGGGFIERTLRLGGSSPVPDWLAQRKMEGTVAITALSAGDHRLAIDLAPFVWDGTSVHFAGVTGRLLDADPEVAAPGAAVFKGDANIDLSEGAPRYRFTGKAGGVPYKGGRLDFEGRVDAAGDGIALLASLRAEGDLSGRSIAFSPDTDFRTVSAHFQASVQGTSTQDASWRWKFTDLEVTQGSEIYLGEGAAQADGKIVLNLSNRGKQVRYTGSLVSLAAQP